jgi:CSLREA domain-containing protein
MRQSAGPWFALPTLVVLLGVVLSALTSDAAAPGLRQPNTIVVNSDDDASSGRCNADHCNLREAIEAANANPRTNVIRFDLPAGARIDVRAPLPPLLGHVHIDGTPPGGSTCPFPGVRIDGSRMARANGPSALADAPVNGLWLLGDGNSVKALAITGFSGDGIAVVGDRNVLQCLFVGVDESGMAPAGNGGHGIVVHAGGENQVGGPTRALGNLLSSNGGLGLRLIDALATSENFNYIGVDITEAPKLPNGNALELLEPLPPPPTSALPPDAAARLAKRVEARVAQLAAQYARAAGVIFDKYFALLIQAQHRCLRTPAGCPARNAGLPPRGDLTALARALTPFPQLATAFVQDMAALNRSQRSLQARQLQASSNRFRDSTTFLRELAPFDAPDRVGDIVDGSAGDVAISGPPSTKLAFRAFDPPIFTQIAPFVFSDLETFGPTAFGADPLAAVGPTCLGPAPCTWPIVYDLRPVTITLRWETSAFTTQEVDDMVTEDGYLLGVFLNGALLRQGPLQGGGLGITDYAVVRLPSAECKPGTRCIAVVVFLRDSLPGVPLPWTFELRIEGLQPTTVPKIVFDRFGNPVVVHEEWVAINRSFKRFDPNETNGSGWFVTAMEPTFRSARCTTCHSLGTIAGVEAHHTQQGVSTFQDAVLTPSLFVPGKHVITCTNCHFLPLTNPDGGSFHEIEWRVPFTDLDVDWTTKTASQICSRVKANLPTRSLRHLHFHGDARLFWAQVVTGAINPLPKAPPQNYAEFLRRFDAWNLGGAPCP